MKVVRASPLDLSAASATQRSPAARIGDLCSPRNFLIDLPADLMRKGQGEHASDTAPKVCGKVIRRDTQEFHCLQESKPDGQGLLRDIQKREKGITEKVEGLFSDAFGCGYENISRQPGHPAIPQAVKGQGDEPRDAVGFARKKTHQA